MALANRASLTGSETSLGKLPHDLVAQIVLRIPPHPRNLLTVSAVCSDWRQLIRGNDFRELTLSHHDGPPLLGFFYRSSDNARCFITEHDLDTTMMPKLPLKDEDYVGDSDSDSDGGVYGTLCILVCRHGRVLLHSSAYPALLIQDPIRNIDAIMCEPLWRGFQTKFNGTILCSSNHGESFSHNCHTSNFLVVWITTNTRQVEVQRYSSETHIWDSIASMPLIGMAWVRESSPATLLKSVLY